MTKFPTLLDAACDLYRRGYRWDADYARFYRGSWSARIYVQKNGAARVMTY